MPTVWHRVSERAALHLGSQLDAAGDVAGVLASATLRISGWSSLLTAGAAPDPSLT